MDLRPKLVYFFQVCHIEMVLSSSDASSVAIVADKLLSEQEADLNLFVITKHHLVNMSHPRRGVRMELEFRRKIMSELMTTYFPSLLLMMITYATTFFKPFFFEVALSVNLTTMLVMTTIFISKMESLPPTSAIKMIDYWLVLCQLVPFTQVVLLTAIEFLREEGEQEENPDEKDDDLAKDKPIPLTVVIPLVGEQDGASNKVLTLPRIKPSKMCLVGVLRYLGMTLGRPQ